VEPNRVALNFTELTTYLIIGSHAKYDKIKAEEVWHDDQTHQNRPPTQ